MACRRGPDVRLPDQRLTLTPRCPLMIAPLHRCPDLKVASVAAEASEICLPRRAELMSNPGAEANHRGIWSSLINRSSPFAAPAAGAATTPGLPVNHHRPAAPGRLTVRSRLRILGLRPSVDDTNMLDDASPLFGSARGRLPRCPTV